MPSREDEHFERYLKRFQPLPPEALPMEADRRRIRRVPVFTMWVAAAAIFVAAVLAIHYSPSATHSLSDGSGNSASVEQITPTLVLTIRDANAWLARAPSFKAAVDEMAMPASTSKISASKRSALAILSQEATKL